MAKTSIYLPDDLAERVKSHGIPVSEVAQDALRQAVKTAEIKENVMTDIQAVAERLRQTRRVAAAEDRGKAERARAAGRSWARAAATAAELEYVATCATATVPGYQRPVSLALFASSESHRVHRELGGLGLPSPLGIPTGPGDPHWAELQAGAREVWEAVAPLLTEIGDHGETRPAGSGGYSETLNPEHRLWLQREPAADAPLDEHDRWLAGEPPEFL